LHPLQFGFEVSNEQVEKIFARNESNNVSFMILNKIRSFLGRGSTGNDKNGLHSSFDLIKIDVNISKASQYLFRKECPAMKKITVADTLELSLPERIQLVEDIWDTIAVEADSLELTEDEKRIIDERLDAYHKNPEAGAPWTEVFKRITAQHGI